MVVAAGTSVFEAKIKCVYNEAVNVIYVSAPLPLTDFTRAIRDACKLSPLEAVTIKWMDDEGDPCTITYQRELDEAFRLHALQKDAQLTVHAFAGTPVQPGAPCPGESTTVYRQGARRWKKTYIVNGHKFMPKRFNRGAKCLLCNDSIWGLGRQGYRCTDCRIAVHKRCHRHVNVACNAHAVPTLMAKQAAAETPAPARQLHGVANPIFDEHSNEAHIEKTPDALAVMQSTGDRMLAEFTLISVIGRGSYATVYQAELKKTKAIYALKVIDKSMFVEEEDIDWVTTEKAVFETASNHPFLVGLHSCFQTPASLFFVIEFVPGGDLMFHMQQKRRLPEEHAKFYSSEIVLALHFLHSRHIIYRDLKLDNVLIDIDGHVKLTDYGMCKEQIGPTDTTDTFCGTPNYIAPEILRGDKYGYSVDWWALGVLMFEMLAGRSPFDIVTNGQAEPEQQTEDYLFQIILEKQIRIPRSLSIKAANVLKQFLNKEPQDRLGCEPNLESSLASIQNHPFFRTVEWELLEQRQVTPPYRPDISGERDLKNFDDQFTEEAVEIKASDPSLIAKIDQSEFDGFEYINPLLMSPEDQV